MSVSLLVGDAETLCFYKEGDQMEKPKKGLSSFQTFWIFGCGVSFFGVILSKTTWIWTGLSLIIVGIVAGALKK